MTVIPFDELPALTPSPTVKIPALNGATKGHVIGSALVGPAGPLGPLGPAGPAGPAGVRGPAGQDLVGLSTAPVQSSDFAASAGASYPVDISSGAETSNIVITLADGAEGGSVSIYDQTRSMTETRTATLSGRIEGDAASSLVMDLQGAEVVLTWRDAVYGYAVKSR